VAFDELIERLYGLPLAEFTRARDLAARELRKAGEREDAERVKALRKPTAAAAAANRLVREHRAEVEAFLGAAAALREVQLAGGGDLGSATERERKALEWLLRAGGDAVRQTLLAAAVDEAAARELLAGRLERELELRGFGTLLAQAKPVAAKRASAGRTGRQAKRPDDRAALAELRAAKEALASAESQERQAVRRLTQTRSAVEHARASVEEAQSALERLHGR
jgi:hypothetical protein